MRQKQYRAIAGSTLVGLVCFTGQAFAYPLLDLDVASSTLLGASKAARAPGATLADSSGVGNASANSALRGASGGGQGQGEGQGQGLSQRASGLGSPLANPGINGPGRGVNGREIGTGLCDTALVKTVSSAGLGNEIIADLCGEDAPPVNGPDGPGIPDDVVVGPTLPGVNPTIPPVDPISPPDFTSPGVITPVLVPVVLAIPEPSALLLLGAGLVGLGLRRRKIA